MSIWKKRGVALMLIRVAVLLSMILVACDSTAAPEKTAPPAPQGVPSEPETAAEESTSGKEMSVSQDDRLNPESDGEQTDLPDEELREETAMKMQVQVGEQIFTATLEDNAATEALVEMMKAAPVELSMSDYSGFEKVGPLGVSLPAEDRQTTTQTGDIVLYTGDQIVIFYGSNSWRYTRLGHIDDLTGWEEALGSGDVTVRLSLKG